MWCIICWITFELCTSCELLIIYLDVRKYKFCMFPSSFNFIISTIPKFYWKFKSSRPNWTPKKTYMKNLLKIYSKQNYRYNSKTSLLDFFVLVKKRKISMVTNLLFKKFVALKKAGILVELEEILLNLRIRRGYVLVSSKHRRHPWQWRSSSWHVRCRWQHHG